MKTLEPLTRIWHTILGLWLCYQMILHKAAQRRFGFGFSARMLAQYLNLIPVRLILVQRFEVRHTDVVETQWDNCDQMLIWLESVNQRIIEGKYLDYTIMDMVHEKMERTLIDMLTDRQGYPLQPLDIRDRLVDVLRKIDESIDNAPPSLHDYYIHRFGYVTTSIVNLIDAYYKAAL